MGLGGRLGLPLGAAFSGVRIGSLSILGFSSFDLFVGDGENMVYEIVECFAFG